jgi:hypothetical protein
LARWPERISWDLTRDRHPVKVPVFLWTQSNTRPVDNHGKATGRIKPVALS